MAWFEDVLTGGVSGLVIGVGAALALPLLGPAAATGLRPVAKLVIKGGLLAADWTQDLLTEVEAQWHTLVAEARAELAAPTATPAADASTQVLKEAAKEVVQEGAVELLTEGVKESL
jgi:hypothetical protein